MDRFDIDPRTLGREETFFFSGPSGRLEARWRPAPPGTTSRGSIVVAHPHPAYGGTLLNKVVFHLARGLGFRHHLDALRFNLRGAGRSEGVYDDGIGERADLRAAWAEARRRTPGLPVVGAGFSFGAAMTLHAVEEAFSEGDPLPVALVLLGLPIEVIEPPSRLGAPVPILAVHGSRDEYTAPEDARRFLEGAPGGLDFHTVPGADHFFDTGLPEGLQFVSRGLDRLL